MTTQLSAKGLELYDQPLSSSLGVQAQLPILLSEYAFYSKQDVEDYLELLSTIDSYYGEIAAFEQQKTEAGLHVPWRMPLRMPALSRRTLIM